MNKILARIKKFSRKEWIYISIWSTLNFIFFIILLTAVGASFLSALAYLVFWELVLFTYYLIRVRKGEKDTKGREWIDAIAFAVITATLIKTFLVDAFTIPTPSMEKSMMVGDFLFVSKWNYGTRVPNTPVAFPFVHNKLPASQKNSYLEIFQLPYWRFHGTSEVNRNDIVVFNYPGRDEFPDGDNVDNQDRPVDKRENYIKRCVAVAGDTFSIVDQTIFINGKAWQMPDDAKLQYKYRVTFKNNVYPKAKLKEEFDINGINGEDVMQYSDSLGVIYVVTLQADMEEAFQNLEEVETCQRMKLPANVPDNVFPDRQTGRNDHNWNKDNMGPIYLPKAGDKITINASNYFLYERCITLYEGNTMRFDPTTKKLYINGEATDSYTFKMNYYWMMGDNRDNSLDSRFWGFVPEDHIVGKAWFTWFSWDKHGDGFFDKVRWNRLFRPVH